MTLGRNSIYNVLKIVNISNPAEPYKVTVQANKNYGICDMSPRVGEILSDFQGRQINDENIENALVEALFVALNPKSENA